MKQQRIQNYADDWDKELIGKTIKTASMSEYDFTFETTEGETYRFTTVGDCCSNSWFESILGMREFIDCTITKIEEVPMPDPAQPEDGYDVIQAYGLKIHTDAGFVLLEYRNESNGYYGGYCELYKVTEA